MEDSISILLSTYNGEKYLEEQIDSIVNQDYKNWSLYIRDDGSLDSTVEIIQRYAQQYSNIYFVESNESLGAALSFLHLLHITDSKYYMFCDQDDIWHSNKISTVYNILKENCNNEPFLVFSNAEVVDQNLKIIDHSFWNYNKISPKLIFSKPDYISIFNCAPGCTMIFNKKLKEYLIDYDKKIFMHDWYVMIKAIQYGTVKHCNKALMMYRQHQNNVIGAEKISIINKFSKMLSIQKSIKTQIEVFNFVRQFTKINIFNYYILKLKFNLLRFKKNDNL